MVNSARKILATFQRSLYKKALTSAYSSQVMTAPAIVSYAAEFYRKLPKQFERINYSILLQAIHGNQLIFYGDFHTLKQSQRGLLRILRSYVNEPQCHKLILALEMFRSKDQQHLEDFQKGNISEQELQNLCNYQENWGFPWKHYKPIIDYCIEHDIKIFGINSNRAGKDALQYRDTFAAKRLVEINKEFPDHKIFCMIGEYHLAENNLPAQVRQLLGSLPFMRILSNVDNYYFSLSQSSTVNPTDYLFLKKDLYCILNTPPWIKWQSFLMWEELKNVNQPSEEEEEEFQDDSDIYTEDLFDIDEQALSVIVELKNFLSLPIEEFDLTRFKVLLFPDTHEIDELTTEYKIRKRHVKTLYERLSIDGIYLLYQSNTFLIADLSLNNLSNLAGQFLRNILNRERKKRLTEGEKFIIRILGYAAGAAATKILNPRKKWRDLWHYRDFLNNNKNKKLIGHALLKRKAALATLRFHNWVYHMIAVGESMSIPPPDTIVTMDRIFSYEVSKSLGEALGYIVYVRVIQQNVSPTNIASLFHPLARDRKSFFKEFYDLYTEIML